MRYAILSDVHANIEALTAVLEAAEGLGAERIVCLGDLVGYCANPGECIALLRGRGIPCVRGNHDSVAGGLREADDFSPAARNAILWTRGQLSPENAEYLAGLPLSLVVDGRFVMVHAALHPEPNDTVRIRNENDAAETLRRLPETSPQLCFFGHTHAGAIYVQRGDVIARHAGEEIELDAGGAYLINPGSVGQPRDGDAKASFAIYDTAIGTVRIHRVEYDRRLSREKAMAAGLVRRPHVLIRSAKWLRDHLRERSVLAPQSATTRNREGFS